MAKNNRVQMTNGFLILALCAGTRHDPHEVSAEVLVYLASCMPECFPAGITLPQAEYMLEHRDEIANTIPVDTE